jgi:transcriptional regulator with XRE-family HTH domain
MVDRAFSTEFVGERIRRLRRQKRLSQVAIQRLTGVSQSTLYRAEAGGILTPDTAAALAAVLGCSAEDLLGAAGEVRP